MPRAAHGGEADGRSRRLTPKGPVRPLRGTRRVVSSDLLIVEFSLELLVVRNLPCSLHEVLLRDVVTFGTDSEHARLSADVPHVSAIEAVGELHNGLPINVAVLRDADRVDLQDIDARLLIRQRDFHLPVQSARAQQGRVEGVWTVRRHDDLHTAQVVESIDLIQKLHERALDLAVSRGSLREPLTSDGIDLVHENDARLVLLGVAEHLADDARALSDVLVDDGRSDDLEEVGGHIVGHGPGQQGLAGARGSVEEHALGRLDSNALEELGVRQR
mmetsp:Transcript_75506/g.161761  ORF Transcript_75506/g.161761 Transcript_75506/m.161761 type:complete len:274 (+) Transcript_75506:100-921(+)